MMDDKDQDREHNTVHEHHSQEQIAKAFAYAPRILQKLTQAGVGFPRFVLFEDASGSLILGCEANNITREQYELACSLVRSRRIISNLFYEGPASEQPIGIEFCCGLISAAEDAT